LLLLLLHCGCCGFLWLLLLAVGHGHAQPTTPRVPYISSAKAVWLILLCLLCFGVTAAAMDPGELPFAMCAAMRVFRSAAFYFVSSAHTHKNIFVLCGVQTLISDL
jgi:hypothetical protein